jgi:hypothetical protein
MWTGANSFRTTATIITALCFIVPLGAAQFAGGTGEPNDPYQIATAEQLISIGSDPNLLDKHFVLTTDIDLDPNLPGGRRFTCPVIAAATVDTFGFQGTPFTGRFQGNSHKIRNLTIECAFGYYVGLFGYVGTDGSVENIEVENVSITGAHYVVGELAGINAGAIWGCRASGSILVGEWPYIESFGGLVGVNAGTIFWSRAFTDIRGDDKSLCLGGLVGMNLGGRIASCYARGTVRGFDSLGGLVGNTVEGIITDCYAQGSVCSKDFSLHSGGLVGYNQAGVIVNCYAATILRNGNKQWDWGGLIGDESARYFSGDRVIYGVVANSFWDTEISGVSASDGGTGLSTSQMYQQETFTGWDFNYTWMICEGRDYPRLRWETIDCNQL